MWRFRGDTAPCFISPPFFHQSLIGPSLADLKPRLGETPTRSPWPFEKPAVRASGGSLGWWIWSFRTQHDILAHLPSLCLPYRQFWSPSKLVGKVLKPTFLRSPIMLSDMRWTFRTKQKDQSPFNCILPWIPCNNSLVSLRFRCAVLLVADTTLGC